MGAVVTCRHEWGEYEYDTGYPRFVKDMHYGRRCSICLVQREDQREITLTISSTANYFEQLAAVVKGAWVKACSQCLGLGISGGKPCQACAGVGYLIQSPDV